MGYCRRCGAKLEGDMVYCPKCGTPVAFQGSSRPVVDEPRFVGSVVLAVVLAVAAIAIIIVALLALGLVPIQVSGPIVGSGNLQTKQFALTDFTIVETSHGFNVVITQASSYSVKVTADDNVISDVVVEKNGDTLTIRLKPSLSITTTTLKAEISMPDLRGVVFSGGVVATATGFDSNNNLNVDVSGGSRFTMSGQAADLSAIGSGGAIIDLGNLQVDNAQVNLSGGSQGTINFSGTLNANLSGGAQLRYKGNGVLGDINTSGGATINKIS
ncbi:MAG: DUF2807 domain-containing protein [Candidatus Bathyarchaeota archaeon]|nr:DUF2807 domain-containing protein [Candidatus Bathyarchaeota archaeon]